VLLLLLLSTDAAIVVVDATVLLLRPLVPLAAVVYTADSHSMIVKLVLGLRFPDVDL
jgi:hypothetical protein